MTENNKLYPNYAQNGKMFVNFFSVGGDMGGDDYDDLVDDPEQIDDMNEDQVGVNNKSIQCF